MNDGSYSRSFGSDAKGSSNVKPDAANQSVGDGDTPKKSIVPKEYIYALKSEVDEMESSSSLKIQRTQEDFAEYLIGCTADNENLLKSPTSATSTPDSGKVVNKEYKKKIATDPSGAFPVYQYKFSSSDALVSIASLPDFY
jgi:hypothetical protein